MARETGAPPARPSAGLRVALVGLLLGIVVVWGWTFVMVKDAIAEYGVISFLAIRFAIASAVLAPLAARRASRATLGVGGGIGVVLVASYLLQTFGLRHTTATNTGLLTGLFIVFAPLANRVLFGVRTSWPLWVGIAVSLFGLCLVTGGAPGGLVLGDLLTVGCAACFGVHVALLDRYAKGHPPLALAFGQVLSAAVLLTVASVLFQPPGWPTPAVWRALLITGVVASAAGFFVQTLVQRTLSAVQTAAIIVTEPIFAAGFCYLLAGDRLTGWQIFGACVMVGALAAVELHAAGRARAIENRKRREVGDTAGKPAR